MFTLETLERVAGHHPPPKPNAKAAPLNKKPPKRHVTQRRVRLLHIDDESTIPLSILAVLLIIGFIIQAVINQPSSFNEQANRALFVQLSGKGK
jgi:hypothetical protein